MTYTTESIREKLLTDDLWLCRGLLAIFNCQTASEQVEGQTKEDNGIGFNGVDAFILSSFAEFYKRTGFLTPKQIVIARKKMGKYCGQLTKIANKE